MHRTPARRSTPPRPRAGCFLNTLGLVFLGVSHTSDGVNLLHPGAILIGLGGITFHLAQVRCLRASPPSPRVLGSAREGTSSPCAVVCQLCAALHQSRCAVWCLSMK